MSETQPSEGARPVRVEMLLTGGHREIVTLPADSPSLGQLFTALASGGDDFVEIPRAEGALTFPAKRLVAVVTEPPILVQEKAQTAPARSVEPRSVEDLRDPPVLFSNENPIALDKKHYPRAQKKADELWQAFQEGRPERLDALQGIIDRLGVSTVAVSTFNAGYAPMFLNWVASCDHHGIPCRDFTILFPTDEAADRLARDRGFVTYFDGSALGAQPTSAAATYGDSDFALAMFPKIAVTQDMLALGIDVLRQDMDLVWFENPIPALAARARDEDLDFLFMRDFNGLFQPLYYNTGFVFIRNNEFSRFTWQTIFDALPSVLYLRSEQAVVDTVVACHKERGLRTARLPEDYVDGQLLVAADVRGEPLPDPRIVAHMSWTVNLEAKIERFKKLGLWYAETDDT